MKARPTPEMIKWHDCEVGYFFHYDITVPALAKGLIKEEFQRGAELPDVSVWNPEQLDTDQWLKAAKEGGARYALLTAKHGTGFCLWPTKWHDYHVGNTPSGRDVVGEFVASCRKYGIKPGLYFSLRARYYNQMFTREDGTLDREGMNRMLLGQLEELLTWYGPIFEIWFDGGVLRPEKGGPDVASVINRVAPELICFGGTPTVRNVLRWSGSEQGLAMPECWSAAHFLTDPERDNVTCDSPGDPMDEVWAPVEVDMPGRDVFTTWYEGWMYSANDTKGTYSADYLFARYLTSVGRNANLLVGAVPNADGIISQDQLDAMTGLGQRIEQAFGKPLGETTEYKDGCMEIRFDEPMDITYAEMMEDQTDGQNVTGWEVSILWPERWNLMNGERWVPLAQGQSIGHKRIVKTELIRAMAIRVKVTDSIDDVKMRSFRVYGQPAYAD